MWFAAALICMLGWGCADLFYKKGTDEDDRSSHLKIAVWVGLVMGVCALCLLPFSETLTEGGFSIRKLAAGAVRYLPASLGYILSMVIGYAGLRYLELSIISPIQNASGALSAIVMTLYFILFTDDKLAAIADETGLTFTDPTGREAVCNFLIAAGITVIVAGVIALAVTEQRLSRAETAVGIPENERKYRFGALALLFPILYCLFDTLGTAADGVILDEETGLGLGEIDVIILYGLTFLLAGAAVWIYMWIRDRRAYNPFARSEAPKGIAAVCEESGQVFYVFAMAEKPVLAAPMIASYCIVSVLLSRIFVGERLRRAQAVCVSLVIAGIVALGVAEGLSF